MPFAPDVFGRAMHKNGQRSLASKLRANLCTGNTRRHFRIRCRFSSDVETGLHRNILCRLSGPSLDLLARYIDTDPYRGLDSSPGHDAFSSHAPFPYRRDRSGFRPFGLYARRRPDDYANRALAPDCRRCSAHGRFVDPAVADSFGCSGQGLFAAQQRALFRRLAQPMGEGLRRRVALRLGQERA